MKTLRQVVGESTQHFGKRTDKTRAQDTVRRQKRAEKCPDCGKVHTGPCSTMSEGKDSLAALRAAHKSEIKRRGFKAHEREELEPERVMVSHDVEKGHSLHSEMGPRGGVRHTLMKWGQ